MMKQSNKKLVLDVVMTLVLLALMLPKFTGLGGHEWVGLFICLAFVLHVALNWSWVTCVTRKFFSKLPAKTRLNYILNALLALGFALIVLSGMAIAKTIDFSWLQLPGEHSFWRGLHVSAAMLTFLAVAMHVGLHWNWILCSLGLKQGGRSILKKILILMLILCISGAAAYSFVSLGFFNKLGMVAHDSGHMQRHGHGQGPHGQGRAGGHGTMSFWDGLLHMGAWFAAFAFVVMLTYYSEQVLKKPQINKKEPESLNGDYCKAG